MYSKIDSQKKWENLTSQIKAEELVASQPAVREMLMGTLPVEMGTLGSTLVPTEDGRSLLKMAVGSRKTSVVFLFAAPMFILQDFEDMHEKYLQI